MTTDLNTLREAMELAFEETDSCIVANKLQKALAALSRLEAAAVPELSREDVERKAREAGFDIFGLPPDILDRFVRFASLVRSVPPTGETNAQLAVHTNHAESEQQRPMAGAVALGQPMGGSIDAGASHSAAEGAERVAVPVGEVKPVGEMIGHHKVGFGEMPTIRWADGYWPQVGAKFYTTPPAPIEGWKLLKDTTHDERSWPEDWAASENGGYQNSCVHCLRMFVGHKRRVVCKVCAAAPQPGDKL